MPMLRILCLALIAAAILPFSTLCYAAYAAEPQVVDGIAAAQFLERMQFHLNSL